jgi:hypothetical protein
MGHEQGDIWVDSSETPIQRIDQALYGVHQTIEHLRECWKDDVDYTASNFGWIMDMEGKLKAILSEINNVNQVSNDA